MFFVQGNGKRFECLSWGASVQKYMHARMCACVSVCVACMCVYLSGLGADCVRMCSRTCMYCIIVGASGPCLLQTLEEMGEALFGSARAASARKVFSLIAITGGVGFFCDNSGWAYRWVLGPSAFHP